MTDDQDLASLAVMPKVKHNLVDEGVSFEQSFVSLPLCCPSRASFLSGRYAHNHGVLLADPDPSRAEYEQKARNLERHTLPLWLQQAGYRTGLVGKYLNGYGDFDRTEIPPGWDQWVSPSGERSIYGYYDFTLNENGELVEYEGEHEYQTDVLTEQAVDFIGSSAGSGPFFLFLAYVAPHIGIRDRGAGDYYCKGSARPAVRHQGGGEGIELPQGPAFNESDVSDKPDFVRGEPLLEEADVANIERGHRCRLESLLAVDEGVEQVVDALDESGELDDTVIVFTSDNGWLEGQHRLRQSKFFPYEESLRVPLVIRGAGGERGSSTPAPAINVDLAPTILDLAGARPDVPLDGLSLLPAIDGGSLPPRDLLFEGFYSNESTGRRTRTYYSSIRDGPLQYTEYRSGEVELYDLDSDSFQLENVARSQGSSPTEKSLRARLKALEGCAGSVSDPVRRLTPCY